MAVKPRVLFILPLPPPVHGSSVMSGYIKESVEKMADLAGDFVNLSTSRHVKEIGKASYKKVFRFFSAYFRVLRLLFSHKYSLCYLAITCHGIGFLKDMPYVLLCKLFCRKVVIHQHNKGMSRDADRWPYRFLFPWVYKNTKVILLSWLLYPDVSRFIKREQVMICPNGIPQPRDKNAITRKHVIPHVLYLSNLIESKGILVLLDSCRILKEQGVGFECHIVGDASKEISFSRMEEEINKRGLAGLVICHGPKYGKEKENYLSQADLFVSPTFDDCFPVVLLEAMQHGLPIVSTYEGAIPDMIQEGVNGILCCPKQPGELAKALSFLLLHEQERIAMGKQGYKRFSELYTLSAYEKNICQIIYDMCVDY